jgi:hypothetical protein
MKRARLSLVLAGAVVLTLGLTACEKPNPGASVFSGTQSEFRRALCWTQEGVYLDETNCASDLMKNAATGPDVALIPTRAGQTVGISVDPVVADTGWYPVLDGTPLTTSPITSTYFRFSPTQEQLKAEGSTLAIAAADDAGTRGVWFFQLVPA